MDSQNSRRALRQPCARRRRMCSLHERPAGNGCCTSMPWAVEHVGALISAAAFAARLAAQAHKRRPCAPVSSGASPHRPPMCVRTARRRSQAPATRFRRGHVHLRARRSPAALPARGWMQALIRRGSSVFNGIIPVRVFMAGLRFILYGNAAASQYIPAKSYKTTPRMSLHPGRGAVNPSGTAAVSPLR